MSLKKIGAAFVAFVLVAVCFVAVFVDDQASNARRLFGRIDFNCPTCFKKDAAEDVIGPVSVGSDWKLSNGLKLPQIIFGVSKIASQTAEQLDAQRQWVGAIVRTAQQGGKIARRVLEGFRKATESSGDLEKSFYVPFHFTWKEGSQDEKSGNFNMNNVIGGDDSREKGWSHGWLAKEQPDREKAFRMWRSHGWGRRLGGRAYADGAWSQQDGASVKAGVEFTWKEVVDVESALIDEVIAFATNAIRQLTHKMPAIDAEKRFGSPSHTRPHNNVNNWAQQSGFRRLGGRAYADDRAAQLIEVFTDDLRAAAAALRTLAQHNEEEVDLEKSRNPLVWLHRGSQGNARDVRSVMPGGF